MVLEPQVLLERLLALVSRPRRHLVTYHGVLAPAAELRSFVVPRVKAEPDAGCRHAPGEEVAVEDEASCRLLPRRVVPHAPGKGRRYSWAELMKRVFLIDVLVCPRCSGTRKVLAAIHDPAAIERVLAALGLASAVPEMAPARAPPGEEWWGA